MFTDFTFVSLSIAIFFYLTAYSFFSLQWIGWKFTLEFIVALDLTVLSWASIKHFIKQL